MNRVDASFTGCVNGNKECLNGTERISSELGIDFMMPNMVDKGLIHISNGHLVIWAER